MKRIELKTCEGFQRFLWLDVGLVSLEDACAVNAERSKTSADTDFCEPTANSVGR
jgi:hypothetical protein